MRNILFILAKQHVKARVFLSDNLSSLEEVVAVLHTELLRYLAHNQSKYFEDMELVEVAERMLFSFDAAVQELGHHVIGSGLS